MDGVMLQLQLKADNLRNTEDSLEKGYVYLRFAQSMIAAQKDFSRARTETEEALKIFLKIGSKDGIKMAVMILGQIEKQTIIAEI